MAKRTYVLHDELGHPWLVRTGDPAFPLVSVLRHPAPVLPFSALRSGTIDQEWYGRVARAVSSLGRYLALEPEDTEIQQNLYRHVAMFECLDQLRAPARAEDMSVGA